MEPLFVEAMKVDHKCARPQFMWAQPEVVKGAFLRSKDVEIEEVMTTIFFFSSMGNASFNPRVIEEAVLYKVFKNFNSC